jgi:hypothetical protein
MPTAPSFADFTRLSEPYIKNGKYYIDVQNPKTLTKRSVRFYDDAEYAKAYGKKESGPLETRAWKNLRHARGFDNGPILVIRNIKPADEDWLKLSCARYAVGIGWHIVSTDTLPLDAPSHLKYLFLSWEEFRLGDDEHIKSPTELSKILEKKAKNHEFVRFPQNSTPSAS